MIEDNEEFNWEAFKPLYAEIMAQLVANPQFNTFFVTHYTLDIIVDDDTQMINVAVRTIAKEETAQRILALKAAQEEDNPLIITPSLYTG